MKHHIIVKYKEDVTDKASISSGAEKLFSGLVGTCPGVHGVVCHRNCIDRSNRYDLMIVIDIDKENLDDYDKSEIHMTWKRDWSPSSKRSASSTTRTEPGEIRVKREIQSTIVKTAEETVVVAVSSHEYIVDSDSIDLLQSIATGTASSGIGHW